MWREGGEFHGKSHRQSDRLSYPFECKIDPCLIEKDLRVIASYIEEAREGFLKDLAEKRQNGQPTLQ
jgi:hypothetical protein